MNIRYEVKSDFTEKQLEDLFLFVQWISGNFPDRLKKALLNSRTVISAWDDEKLVGLVRGLDDGVWQATIDCLLVHPKYQGCGIGARLLADILEKYRDFLYVTVVPDEEKNVAFYKKYGFELMENGTPLIRKGGIPWK